MFQPSLIARLGVLLVGAHLALASSAWAAAPFIQKPKVVKKAAPSLKHHVPLLAKKPVALTPKTSKVPRSIARPADPVKPTGTTGKSLVSQGGPLSGLAGDSAAPASPFGPTLGTKPAKTRSTTGASQSGSLALLLHPGLQVATNPIVERLKGIHDGERPVSGHIGDFNKGGSDNHSAKGHHDDDVHKSANVSARVISNGSSSGSSSSGSAGGSSGQGTGSAGSSGGARRGSTFQHHPNGTTTITRKDGTVTDVWPDGTIVTSRPDGTMEVNRPNGQTDFYGKNRKQTGTEDPDNSANGQSHPVSDSKDSKNKPEPLAPAPSNGSSDQSTDDSQSGDDGQSHEGQ